MNIIKYISYAFKTKKGIQHTDELMTDISFGPVESFFILSFIFLGIITAGLGFTAFYFSSKIILFFAIMFLFVLSLDIWIFIKIKKFFISVNKKIVHYSQKKYKQFQTKNVVDIDVDEINHD